MENVKKSKKLDVSKETRWDRISKKHLNSVNVTTENVKKFFGMNFVNARQLKTMNGESMKSICMDPMLVMNMRHEIIRSAKRTNGKVDPLKSLQMEKLKNHHNTVEERYLDYELDKFKEKMNLIRTSQIVVMSDNKLPQPGLCEWNSGDFVKDFYRDNLTDLLAPNEGDVPNADIKSVHFGNFVEIINPSTEETMSTISQECSVIELEECVRTSEIDEDHVSNTNQANSVLAVELKPRKSTQVWHQSFELIGRQMQPNTQMPQTSTATVITIDQPSDECAKNSQLDTNNPLIITKFTVDGNLNVGIFPSEITANDEIAPADLPFPPLEQTTIIAGLFQEHFQNPNYQKSILQKFFLKWIHFTTIEKMTSQNMQMNQSRTRKIEQFLDNIRLEKKRIFAKDTALKCAADGGSSDVPVETVKKNRLENPVILAKKYSTKIKIQQDIIDLQKIKLERQERMITELKLSKISDETKESQAIIKQELKNVIKNGCSKSRSKARCLQLVGNLKDEDDEEEYAKLQARGVPKFLIDMQARALERTNRHKEARDRREQLERQKEEQRLAAEEAKRQLDEEAKRQRMEELREKRRQERIMKQQREEERLRQIDNYHKATVFYRRWLLTKLGMNRFKMLVKIKKRNIKNADQFQRHSLLSHSFKYWRLHVQKVWEERKRMADENYKRHLLKMGIGFWKKYQLIQQSKMLVAIDWHEMKLAEHILRIWNGFTKHQKLIEEIKMRQADSHYNWHLKWRVLDHWQRLHTILRIEKETDERRQRWRIKIWELLPDYTPNNEDV